MPRAFERGERLVDRPRVGVLPVRRHEELGLRVRLSRKLHAAPRRITAGQSGPQPRQLAQLFPRFLAMHGRRGFIRRELLILSLRRRPRLLAHVRPRDQQHRVAAVLRRRLGISRDLPILGPRSGEVRGLDARVPKLQPHIQPIPRCKIRHGEHLRVEFPRLSEAAVLPRRAGEVKQRSADLSRRKRAHRQDPLMY